MSTRGPRQPVLIVLVMILVAISLRIVGLSEPDALVWDESYYVLDAAAYLGGGDLVPIPKAPESRIASEATWVQPPLGKWIIALLGVGPFGERPPGDRLPSVLFGVAGVLLVYLLAMELWGSVWWASMAGLLLATDGLHVVQSRLATLDIFVTTFSTAGMWLIVRDRRRRERGEPERPGRVARMFGSRELLLAGLCLGSAVATKWSGVLILAAGLVLGIAWRRVGARRSWATFPASLVAVPLLLYAVSYGAFWFQHGPEVPGFVKLQAAMLREQMDHPQVQPENSPPWTWPLLTEPIRYWPPVSSGAIDPNEGRIVLLGNPVLFWGFLAMLPLWLVSMIRSPKWQDGVPATCFLFAYLPWFMLGRTQFLYYLLPAVPFMALAIVAGLRRLGPRPSAAAGRVVALAATVAAAAFAPIWTGIPAPSGWMEHLDWLPSWP